MGATFGQPKGTLKPDANTFRKKGTGTIVLPQGMLFMTDPDLMRYI
jgi:hypothetical protein